MTGLNKYNPENTKPLQLLAALEALTHMEWDFAGPALLNPCIVYPKHNLDHVESANFDRLCREIGMQPSDMEHARGSGRFACLFLKPAQVQHLLDDAQTPEAIETAALNIKALAKTEAQAYQPLDVQAHIDRVNPTPVKTDLADALGLLTGTAWHAFHTPSKRMTGAGCMDALSEPQKATLMAFCAEVGIRPILVNNVTMLYADEKQIKALVERSQEMTFEEIAEAPKPAASTAISAILEKGPKDPMAKSDLGGARR